MVTCQYDISAEDWSCNQHEEEEFAHVHLSDRFGAFVATSMVYGGQQEAVAAVETVGGDSCKEEGTLVRWRDGQWNEIADASFKSVPAAIVGVPLAASLQCQSDKASADVDGSSCTGNECLGQARPESAPFLAPSDYDTSTVALAVWSRSSGRFVGMVNLNDRDRLKCSRLPDFPEGWHPAFGVLSGEVILACGGSSFEGQQATERCLLLERLRSDQDPSWVLGPSMSNWRSQVSRATNLGLHSFFGGTGQDVWVVGGDTKSRCSFRRAENGTTESLYFGIRGIDLGEWSLDVDYPFNGAVSCFADAGAGGVFLAAVTKPIRTEGSAYYVKEARKDHLVKISSPGKEKKLLKPLCVAITSREAQSLSNGASGPGSQILILDRGNKIRAPFLFDPKNHQWTELSKEALPEMENYQEKLWLSRSSSGEVALLVGNRGRSTAGVMTLDANSGEWRWRQRSVKMEAPRRLDEIVVELSQRALDFLC